MNMITNNLGSFGSVHFFRLFPVPAYCANSSKKKFPNLLIKDKQKLKRSLRSVSIKSTI